MDKKRTQDQLNRAIKDREQFINTHELAIKQCKLDVAEFEKQLKDLEPKGEFDWLVDGESYWSNSAGNQENYVWVNDRYDKGNIKELNVYKTKELCRIGHIRDVIARTKGDWDGEGDFHIWDGKAAGSYYGSVRISSYNQPKFNTAKACDEFWTEERKEAQAHFNTYK